MYQFQHTNKTRSIHISQLESLEVILHFFLTISLQIIDVNTQESLGSGGQGEIWVKTPALFTEYRNLPERRAEALEDGCWFKTGALW